MSGPLRGVGIVMMGGLGRGPFYGMVLGDLGADVVRVDEVRQVDGPLPIDYTVRRNQRSIALDVKDPRGRAVVHRLPMRSSRCTDPEWPSASASGPTTCSARIRSWCTPA